MLWDIEWLAGDFSVRNTIKRRYDQANCINECNYSHSIVAGGLLVMS